ncbi:septum site-determining protein MinD [Paenibacillus thiaminolyticus]|uniref:Septum site-determining protein MinD n=3 Tax=Paenibacillus TaxID=44249 RepID=H3SF85_9BACL|nr:MULTISPECIES: septum site-determining protein MinD [Paenibacillus]MEB9894384.1 septum site-determining protein MinD [Bacillus cereus]EHQ62281.1 Septum site-determining protein minD (cell division inhibitor minD) [Paenibacillus dendritiformis C454]MCY9535684.1 septum site-determining protein MinD [Paenibacillus thiaminolyticus]MCY9600010.1 septum site-determining protein MinD [Paenibacillus thiaminolyticus]MCY9610468.1 septum site-determining protein MinD [Paenibacillus thiaminolyticus]
MGEAIVVTSGKGGVGKTTTSANLGTALALLGKKVCMVDTDIGLRNLDVVMGLENRIIYDICDVADGRCRLNQALVKDKRFDELYMLPAAQTKDKDAVSPEQVKDIILELKKEYEYIIIDCPAGIEQGFKNAIAGADRAIVVTTPENAAVRDADRIIGLLENANVGSPKLIVNRIRSSMVKSGEMLDLDDILQVLNIELLGIVPDDELVIRAANAGEPTVMNPDSRAAVAYRNIARRILGDTVPLMPLDQKKGVLTRMKKFFGMG